MSEMTKEQIEYIYSTTEYLLSRKGYLTASDVEEYTQATVAHIFKYWKYDPSKGCTWKTYAVRAIRNRLGCLMKKHWENVHDSIEEDSSIEDKIANKIARQTDTDVYALIDDIVPDPTLNKVVKLKYEGHTHAEIEELIGIKFDNKFWNRLWNALRHALEEGKKVVPQRGLRPKQRGRCSAYHVQLLTDDDRVISEYPSVNQFCIAMGVHHHKVSEAKDGNIHEWRGVRWRMILTP